MKIHLNVVSAAALCAIVSMPMIAGAQETVMHHPAKAPPIAPMPKPAIVAAPLKPSAVAPLQAKPIVATAVVSKPPVPDTHRSIIFVGGKPQTGSKVELNPQPIPPGHGSPGNP